MANPSKNEWFVALDAWTAREISKLPKFYAKGMGFATAPLRPSKKVLAYLTHYSTLQANQLRDCCAQADLDMLKCGSTRG